MARSSSRSNNALDRRLLTHHPAGQQCLDVCNANGWQPGNGDVLRLVKLWDEVRQGRRSEVALDAAHLGFARWLIANGRLSEGDGGLDLAA